MMYAREVDGTWKIRPVEKKAAESVGALLQAKIRADCWHEHRAARYEDRFQLGLVMLHARGEPDSTHRPDSGYYYHSTRRRADGG